mgnify:CR=1 FL=1
MRFRTRQLLSIFACALASSALFPQKSSAQSGPGRCLGGVGVKCISPIEFRESLSARLIVKAKLPDGKRDLLGSPSSDPLPFGAKLKMDISTAFIPGSGQETRTLRVKIPGLLASDIAPGISYVASLSKIRGSVKAPAEYGDARVQLSGFNVKVTDQNVSFTDDGDAYVDVQIVAKPYVCASLQYLGAPGGCYGE